MLTFKCLVVNTLHRARLFAYINFERELSSVRRKTVRLLPVLTTIPSRMLS